MRQSLAAAALIYVFSTTASYAGYAIVNGLPPASTAANAAMGAALADKLATLRVNASLGAQIMRTVARSAAVRFLGKSVVWAAPLLIASDTGLFDEQTPTVLVHGDGSTIQFSGPAMDLGQKPQTVMPTGGWSAVIQNMGYPASKTFADKCGGADCVHFIMTYQWPCPTANQVCTVPVGSVNGAGYTVQSSLSLGWVGDNRVYNYILVAEQFPQRALSEIKYTPVPLSTPQQAASALPDTRANDNINLSALASALSAAIDDARARAPGLAWPSELAKPNSISPADVKNTGLSVPLTGALAPVATGANDQAPPGWMDARPSTSYWDPAIPLPGTWPGSSTSTGTETGSGNGSITVDFGTAPDVSEPTLEETPTGMQIMQPVIDALNPLKGISLPSGNGQCPVVDLDLSFFRDGAIHHLGEQCEMFEKARPILEPVFAACWALLAVFIVLRA